MGRNADLVSRSRFSTGPQQSREAACVRRASFGKLVGGVCLYSDMHAYLGTAPRGSTCRKQHRTTQGGCVNVHHPEGNGSVVEECTKFCGHCLSDLGYKAAWVIQKSILRFAVGFCVCVPYLFSVGRTVCIFGKQSAAQQTTIKSRVHIRRRREVCGAASLRALRRAGHLAMGAILN